MRSGMRDGHLPMRAWLWRAGDAAGAGYCRRRKRARCDGRNAIVSRHFGMAETAGSLEPRTAARDKPLRLQHIRGWDERQAKSEIRAQVLISDSGLSVAAN